MKTKPFLLATAGSTVDGRVIDDKDLKEMASSYDPQTYGARLNIEHIRGFSGEKPFHAYGDVLELSTAEVEVNFNGETEKRLGLYGIFDVSDDAKALNDAGQKMYPSIEIEPNFGGKNFAYCMGVALTDSPAAIATERLQFKRTMPGTINLSRDESAALEFADASASADGGDGFIKKFGDMLDKTFAKIAPAAPKQDDEPKQPDPKPDETRAFAIEDLRPMLEELGQTFAASIDGLRTELREETDRFAVKIKALETTVETTPDKRHSRRPAADGDAGKLDKVF